MFRSTYELTRASERGPQPLFVHKAVDFERSIEVFRIGRPSGDEVPFLGDIYCLKIRGDHIPFVLHSEKTISSVAIDSFNRSNWKSFRPGVFPELAIEISHFGTDLNSFVCGRGRLSYRDCWPGSAFHGHRFASADEKAIAFSYLQEALPILYFDDYSVTRSRPAICRFIMPFQAGGCFDWDGTGTIEQNSFTEIATAREPEALELVLSRMEENGRARPLKVEDLMCELLDIERRTLFYWVFHTSGIIDQERFFDILRRSYQAHYREDLHSFEKFLVAITALARDRMHGRMVYEMFSGAAAP